MKNAADDSLTVQLGLAIRARRRELGLTQEELAESLGIGHQSLSRIEQGRVAPKMDRLPLLAEQLKCTVADLFRGVDTTAHHDTEEIFNLLSRLSSHDREFVHSQLTSLVHFLTKRG